MKVLLIISNRYLFRSIRQSFVIWFLTSLLGCTILYGLGFFFLQSPEEFIQSLGLSLIFSSPAVVVAAGVLYTLSSFNHVFTRTTIAIAAIVITSGIIIWIVASTFDLEYLEVARVLYPFTLSALTCFFLIARKQIIPVKTLIN